MTFSINYTNSTISQDVESTKNFKVKIKISEKGFISW